MLCLRRAEGQRAHARDRALCSVGSCEQRSTGAQVNPPQIAGRMCQSCTTEKLNCTTHWHGYGRLPRNFTLREFLEVMQLPLRLRSKKEKLADLVPRPFQECDTFESKWWTLAKSCIDVLWRVSLREAMNLERPLPASFDFFARLVVFPFGFQRPSIPGQVPCGRGFPVDGPAIFLL